MMVGSRIRLAAVTAFCLLTAACASSPSSDYQGSSGWSSAESAPLQCVPYARDHSAVKIYGDAADWCDKSAVVYQRGEMP